MLRSLLAIALAAVALATPAPEAGEHAVAPPKKKEFGVAFTISVNGDMQDLYAYPVQNGTAAPHTVPTLVLVGRSEGPGAPAYINGTTALDFDLTSSRKDPTALYGAQIYDLGKQYGLAVPVRVIKGVQDKLWIVKNGYISHKFYDKHQGFYACSQTVNGKTAYVLNIGVSHTNGKPPANCQATLIKQFFDIPGGAKPSN